MDISALRTATEQLASYLSEVTPGDLTSPTPCEEWDVKKLYHHLLDENLAFAQALTGAPRAPDASPDFASVPPAGDMAHHGFDHAYRRTARDMEDAFASTDDESQVREVPGVPGARSIDDLYGMQLCDTVIHTWDLARALGFEWDVDPTVAALVVRRLELLPGSARGTGKAFGQVRHAVTPDRSTLERILILSGRTPEE